MEPRYVAAFVYSIQHVFSTMLSQEVLIEGPTAASDIASGHDVSGIIGLSGDVVGNVVVSFPMATAEHVVSAFAGTPITANDDDFTDAIGEMTNMISGCAKGRFENKDVSISCPSVVVGAGHRVFRRSDFQVVEFRCECPLGPFMVAVTMKEVAAEAARPSAAKRAA